MVPGQPLALTTRWRLVDRLVAGYGFAVAAIAVTRLSHPGVAPILAAHLALPAMAWLVANAPDTKFSRVLRAIYPIVLVIGLYSAIDVLNGSGAATTWDYELRSVERGIFGMEPSRDWWRLHPSVFWSSVLHLAYLSYYVVIPLPVLVFLARKQSQIIERYLNGVIATYFTCYLCYLLFPVSGPYYQFARPDAAMLANFPARMVYGLLGQASAFGAAFPSSHVAAMTAATIGAWRGSRRLGIGVAIATAAVAVGVVYTQMHYAIDSIAGLLLGAAVAGAVHRKR